MRFQNSDWLSEHGILNGQCSARGLTGFSWRAWYTSNSTMPAFERGQEVRSAFRDISKAFDKV